MKNQGLGRGLSALLGDTANHPQDESGAMRLRVSEIEPNEEQPRKHFDETALTDLAESIKLYGVLTPLLVRRTRSGSYQILAGERRWRAARMAGLTTVPAIIHDADDRLATEIALIENLQREDLNPVEIAEGYKSLMEEYGLTQDEVASRVGKSRPAVANTLRLLNLSAGVLVLVVAGKISEGHARALIPLQSKKKQELVAAKIINGGLSVRQTESMVKKLLTANATNTAPKPAPLNFLKEHEDNLSTRFSRKVNITSVRGKGKITLEYYGSEDLENLINILLDKEL